MEDGGAGLGKENVEKAESLGEVIKQVWSWVIVVQYVHLLGVPYE